MTFRMRTTAGRAARQSEVEDRPTRQNDDEERRGTWHGAAVKEARRSCDSAESGQPPSSRRLRRRPTAEAAPAAPSVHPSRQKLRRFPMTDEQAARSRLKPEMPKPDGSGTLKTRSATRPTAKRRQRSRRKPRRTTETGDEDRAETNRRASRGRRRSSTAEETETEPEPRPAGQARAAAEDSCAGRRGQPAQGRGDDRAGPRAGERQGRHRAGHQGRRRPRPHPRRRQAAARRGAAALLCAQQAQGLCDHGQGSRGPAHGDAVLRQDARAALPGGPPRLHERRPAAGDQRRRAGQQAHQGLGRAWRRPTW